MKGFSRSTFNPLERIKQLWPEAKTDHITYDEKLIKGDYYIIRQCGGDGVHLFIIEMMEKALINLVNMISCHTSNVNDKNIIGFNYIVGKGKHSTVYCKLKLKCGGTYQGQRDRVRIPVKCIPIYK